MQLENTRAHQGSKPEDRLTNHIDISSPTIPAVMMGLVVDSMWVNDQWSDDDVNEKTLFATVHFWLRAPYSETGSYVPPGWYTRPETVTAVITAGYPETAIEFRPDILHADARPIVVAKVLPSLFDLDRSHLVPVPTKQEVKSNG